MNLSASISFSAILHASWLAAAVLVPVALGLESRPPAETFERPVVRMDLSEAPTLAAFTLPWEEEPPVDAVEEPEMQEPAEVREEPAAAPEAIAADRPRPAPQERVQEVETPSPELPVERAVAVAEDTPLPPAREAPSEEVERVETEAEAPSEALAQADVATPEEEAAPLPEMQVAAAPADERVGDARIAERAPSERTSVSEERPALPDLDALLDGYTARLNTIVRRHYEYPRIARRAGLQGTVIVEVIVDDQGRVIDVRLRQSSGHGVLDRAAIASIRSIGAFPAPPAEMSWDRRPIEIPMVYTL